MNLDRLDEVKLAFSEWRAQRPKPNKIPNQLWGLVKPLLNDYPQSMVSRALGISSSQIRNNVLEKKVTFVECETIRTTDIAEANIGAQTSLQTCNIELERPCGSILKINSLSISEVPTLISSFIGN